MENKTIFDNKYTLAYKAAVNFNTAVNYVYYDNEFKSIFDFILQNIKLQLHDLYTRTKSIINISEETFTYLYIVAYTGSSNTLKIPSKLEKELSVFSKLEDLKLAYEYWYTEFYLKEVYHDYKIYTNIVEIENELAEEEPLPYHSIEITHTTEIYLVQYKGIDVKTEDGIDIFNMFRTSDALQFITYVDDIGIAYYKVNKENSTKELSDYLPLFGESGMLYFLVMYDSKFYDCKLSLKKGTLEVSSPDNDAIVEVLHQMYEDIDFFDPEDIRIKGTFVLENVIISYPALHFLLLTEELFYTYIYFEEKDKALVDKKNIEIHYKTFLNRSSQSSAASVSITFMEEQTEEQDIRPLKINIVKAESRETLDEFLTIFSRLMHRYMVNVFTINSFITEYIPEIELPTESEGTKTDIHREINESKNKNLKQKAPHMYVHGKSRVDSIGCDEQPIIIADDEVEEWRQYSYTDYTGTKQARDIERVEELNFVCPTNNNPYIHLMKNSEGYDFVKCKETPQSPERRLELTASAAQQKEQKKRKVAYKISQMKIIPFGKTDAELPKHIKNLLSTMDKNADFVRAGSIFSTSSLLHCIMMATYDEGYLSQISDEDKEKYVVKKRFDLAKRINPAIYRQELHDMDNTQILESLQDPAVYLDPALHYRGIEEYFHVNIFVFAAKDEDWDSPVLEMPRYQKTYIRTENNLPTILILKHIKNKKLHCELIRSRGKVIQEKNTKKYGNIPSVVTKGESVFPTLTTPFFAVFRETVRNIVVTSVHGAADIELRVNPYVVNFKTLGDFTKQIIDQYGKTIALIMKDEFTLFIPPTQPLNIPSTKNVVYASTHEIEAVFGEPYRRTDAGYWYNIVDFEYGVFIPTIAQNQASQDQNMPYMYNEVSDMNKIIEMRKVKRYVNFLMQIINWLWKLTILSNKTLTPIKDWWDNYVIIGDLPYKEILIKRLLPDIKSTSEGILVMSTLWSQFFSSNKIVLYKELYQHCKAYFMKEYELIIGLPNDSYYMRIPTYLDEYYIYEDDFNENHNTLIFIKRENMVNWFDYKINMKNQSREIITKLDLSMFSSVFPIPYRAGKKLYLIQNVFKNGLKECLHIANYWDLYRVNEGYDAKAGSEEYDNYLVYGIATNGEIVPIENHIKSIPYLEVIEWGINSKKYGALLSMLS